jgi:competence protein ComEC
VLSAVSVDEAGTFTIHLPFVNGAQTPTATATTVSTFTPTPTATSTSAPIPTATPTSTSTPPPTATSITARGTLDVHFLDVGQGDSTLLVGPDFTILIDAGRRDRTDVVPSLEQIGITSIDLLVGTHPHADHIGQFPEVLARFPVTEVWMSGDEHTSLTFERAIDAILASQAAYREPRANEVYQIGSATVEVLNPLTLTGDFHEGSISLRIVFGDVAFLFTGDAEAVTEQAMIDRGHQLSAQILQLGHHGSRTSSSAAFLDAVQPQLAIWSAGLNNSFGHPHADVLERLAAKNIVVCGTATYGTIVVDTDGQSCTVKTQACAEQQQPAPTATVVPAATATPTATPPTSQCVNINTASFEDLQRIVHMGPERVTQLISLRPFRSIDDMTRISGIGSSRLQDIKDQGLACV